MRTISLCRKVIETAEIVLTYERSLLDSTAVSSTRRMKDVPGAELPDQGAANSSGCRKTMRAVFDSSLS